MSPLLKFEKGYDKDVLAKSQDEHGINSTNEMLDITDPKEAIIVNLDVSASMSGKAGFIDDYNPDEHKIDY